MVPVCIVAKEYYEIADGHHVSAFSQIGPPLNLSVSIKPDGFLVSWDSPEYGQDMLSIYVVRWFLQPEHKLHGRAETRNNFYLGELPFY